MADFTPLSRSFYTRPAQLVAPALLGQLLVRRLPGSTLLVGKIVETEAYSSTDDQSAHFRDQHQTKRTAVVFGPPGHAYIYHIHLYYCFNVVCDPVGIASAVLIRALEPITSVTGKTFVSGYSQ